MRLSPSSGAVQVFSGSPKQTAIAENGRAAEDLVVAIESGVMVNQLKLRTGFDHHALAVTHEKKDLITDRNGRGIVDIGKCGGIAKRGIRFR